MVTIKEKGFNENLNLFKYDETDNLIWIFCNKQSL